MKRTLAALAAVVCLMCAAGFLGVAYAEEPEGFETPYALIVSYLKMCGIALENHPAIGDREEAIPALMTELAACLDPEAEAAEMIRLAAEDMKSRNEAAVSEAGRALWKAAFKLDESEVVRPVALDDLVSARVHHLLPVTTTEEYVEAFTARAEAMMTDFMIIRTPQVDAQMAQLSSAGDDTSLLSTLEMNCGMYKATCYDYSQQPMTVFVDAVYYPGLRAVQAWQRGQVGDLLSGDERRMLDAALDIAAQASGTELQRELAIHDALCARIAYSSDDDPFNRDDTAVGALLDGLANCDGYSDAFFLCGTLAGLEIRYVHGDSVDEPEPIGESAEADGEEEELEIDNGRDDATHMWNLVRIDGTWAFVDLTWDDSDNGRVYTNYNLGAARCGLSHTWDPAMLTVPVPAEVDGALWDSGVPTVSVAPGDDVYAVLKRHAGTRGDRLRLAFPVGEDLGAWDEQVFAAAHSTGLEGSLSYREENGFIELIDMVYYDEFRICDSMASAAGYLEECAARGVGDFNVYFEPPVAQRAFADDRAEIAALLGASRLVDTQYSYNEEYGRIVVTGAAYYDTVNPCAGIDDVRRLLKQTLIAQGASEHFLLTGAEDYQAIRDEMFDCIYGYGVDQCSTSTIGRRVTISELKYYPEYRLCDTQQQAADYLENCAARGTGEFKLYFEPSLARTMFANDHSALYELLGASRLAEIHYQYNEDYGRVAVSGATYLDSLNVCRSMEDVRRLLRKALGAQRASVIFLLPQAVTFDSASQDILYAVYGCGVEDFSWNHYGHRVVIRDVSYYPEYALADSEQQFTDYLKSCRQRGVTDFRIYCSDALYGDLTANDFTRFWKLIRQSKCHAEECSYNDSTHMLAIQNASW